MDAPRRAGLKSVLMRFAFAGRGSLRRPCDAAPSAADGGWVSASKRVFCSSLSEA